MNWREYDEIYLSPKHAAEDKLAKENQRKELDARNSEIAEGDE